MLHCSLLGHAQVIPLVGKQPEKKLPELIQAEKFFAQGDIDKAFESLEAASKKDAGLPPPPLLLVRLALAQGRTAGVRPILEKNWFKQPGHPAWSLAFAQINLAEGRHVEALALIERTVAQLEAKEFADVRHTYLRECHAGKAHLYEQRQDWDKARAALADWLKLDPKHAVARQRLGRTLFFLDKPSEALAEFQQAHALDASIEHPYLSMGLLWTQKKEMKQAEQWMVLAVKEAGKDVRTRLAVASWLLEQERTDDAAREADAALRQEPGSTEAKRLRGLIHRHQRNFDKAEELFEPLHRDFPADFFVSNQLALALAEQGDGKKLKRALDLALVNARQYPNHSEAQAALARVYYLLGQWPEADKILQNAMRAGRLSSDTAYYYACVLDQLKRTDEARKLLKAALDATGPFVFRKEARQLSDRLEKGPK